MELLLRWPLWLTNSLALLIIRQRQIEARLKQLDEEVRALLQQRPHS